MLKSLVVLSAGLALCGCRSVAGPEASLKIETDRDTYTAEASGAAVGFHVVNVGREPVLLQRCGERVMVGVEPRQDGTWGLSSGDACPAVLPMVALKLGPGESVSSLTSLQESGTYRLRLHVRFDTPQAAHWSAASNAFTVR